MDESKAGYQIRIFSLAIAASGRRRAPSAAQSALRPVKKSLHITGSTGLGT